MNICSKKGHKTTNTIIIQTSKISVTKVSWKYFLTIDIMILGKQLYINEKKLIKRARVYVLNNIK